MELTYNYYVDRDGKNLVSGGRSNLLHRWCLENKQLIRVIQMPSQVRTIRQLEFVPDSFDSGANQVRNSRAFQTFLKLNFYFSLKNNFQLNTVHCFLSS